MTLTTIQSVWVEGALTFTFPPQSLASKYDDWSHYRNQFQSTCGSSKAVDFVFCDQQTLWLIEVKDFRGGKRTKAIELVDEISIKVRDTVAGLVSAKFYANDPEEKKVAQTALRAARVRVVCHIEQPVNPSRLFPVTVNPCNLQLKLRTSIKSIDPHLRVVDRQSLTATIPWSVQ